MEDVKRKNLAYRCRVLFFGVRIMGLVFCIIEICNVVCSLNTNQYKKISFYIIKYQ